MKNIFFISLIVSFFLLESCLVKKEDGSLVQKKSGQTYERISYYAPTWIPDGSIVYLKRIVRYTLSIVSAPGYTEHELSDDTGIYTNSLSGNNERLLAKKKLKKDWEGHTTDLKWELPCMDIYHTDNGYELAFDEGEIIDSQGNISFWNSNIDENNLIDQPCPRFAGNGEKIFYLKTVKCPFENKEGKDDLCNYFYSVKRNGTEDTELFRPANFPNIGLSNIDSNNRRVKENKLFFTSFYYDEKIYKEKGLIPRLASMNIDGSDFQILWEDMDGIWSPDLKKIIYRKESSLYLGDLETKQKESILTFTEIKGKEGLFDVEYFYNPVSFNGKKIILEKVGGLVKSFWVVNIDGTELKEILREEERCVENC